MAIDDRYLDVIEFEEIIRWIDGIPGLVTPFLGAKYLELNGIFIRKFSIHKTTARKSRLMEIIIMVFKIRTVKIRGHRPRYHARPETLCTRMERKNESKK